MTNFQRQNPTALPVQGIAFGSLLEVFRTKIYFFVIVKIEIWLMS